MFGQMHSSTLGFVKEQVGGWVVSPGELCGNGVALASMRAASCAGVRLSFTERMSAAMPDTTGVAKLVPTLGLVSFV